MGVYGLGFQGESTEVLSSDAFDVIVGSLLAHSSIVSVDGGINPDGRTFEFLLGVEMRAPGLDEKRLAADVARDAIHAAFAVAENGDAHGTTSLSEPQELAFS